MAVTQDELKNILQEKFPEAEIILEDLAGDQDHYSLYIKDNSFAGKSVMTQHKMVKDALKTVLSTKLHSITIKTLS
ncbi:MAG: BolA/IbaG family iron-sulfur metabolism protein [Rickettsiaceae bacterium]|nr:BolA/IbaG family iron-sulfur metabolism protein [Rickettsiaceae bacterium]